MARNDMTSEIIDSILKLALTGAALTAAMVLPNLMIALDKPLKKQFDRIDAKNRDREVRRVVSYMKSRGLLSGTYDHGLQITKKGRRRLSKVEFDNIQIAQPPSWDHNWRIVFYNIPEEHMSARKVLVAKLRSLGFSQLQRSVFIHPLPCREVIEKIANAYSIDQYVSYIETPHLDNERLLIARFSKTMPGITFK